MRGSARASVNLQRINESVGDELDKVKSIREELKLMHKLVDLKDAYRLYRTQHRTRQLDHLKSFISNTVDDLINGYLDVKKN